MTGDDDRPDHRPAEETPRPAPDADQTAPPLEEALGAGSDPDPADGPPHDAVGAYVLDALPEEERLAFAAHLAGCPACRAEVARLAPVVALLPRVLELDPVLLAAVDDALLDQHPTGDLPAPSPDLRDRIVAAARGEGRPTATAEAEVVDAGPDPAAATTAAPVIRGLARPMPVEDAVPPSEGSARPTRPRGRIRPGVPIAGEEGVIGWPARRREPRWLAAAVLAVVAVGAIIWALALLGRVDDQRTEIAALNDEVERLRRQNNATAAALAPTEAGPASADGILLYSLAQQTGVLLVRGLEPVPDDMAYQLWYIAGSDAPRPGPTFDVDSTGTGVVVVDPTVPRFDAVALTKEPAAGSEAPSSAIVLMGELGGAAGALPPPDRAARAFTAPRS